MRAALTPLALVKGTRWIWTLLILGLIAGQCYLALWQWQRYQLRLDQGALLSRQLQRETVTIPWRDDQSPFPAADQMHYRRATVQGTYDFTHQFLWVGPRDRMEAGPHLVTPVLLPDGRAILVDRGWISAAHETPEQWRAFDGQVEKTISGILLPATAVPDPEFLAQQPRPILFWAQMDLPALQDQLPYPLLPVYLHQEPDAGTLDEEEPRRTWYTLRTPPSMHLSYAVQWIMIALILGFLYVMIIRFIERRALYRATDTGEGHGAASPPGNPQEGSRPRTSHG